MRTQFNFIDKYGGLWRLTKNNNINAKKSTSQVKGEYAPNELGIFCGKKVLFFFKNFLSHDKCCRPLIGKV